MINELIEKEINKFMDKMRNINSIESPDIYLDRVRKFSTELSCGVAKEVAKIFGDMAKYNRRRGLNVSFDEVEKLAHKIVNEVSE